jgi:hypothetical protein
MRGNNSPLVAFVCEENTTGEGFPSLVASACDETRRERVNPLLSRLCEKKHGAKGKPPLVAFVCEEDTTGEGQPPLVASACHENTTKEGKPPLVASV